MEIEYKQKISRPKGVQSMDANYTSRRRKVKSMETVYIAGGCLWGVQHFFDTVPGVRTTEAWRANGTTNTLDGPYDGYAAVSYTHLTLPTKHAV